MRQAAHESITPTTNPDNLRTSVARAIEALIDVLDQLEPDPDLEDGDADDPSRVEGQNSAAAVANMALGHEDDEDSDPAEDDGTAEPSLGAIETHASGYGADRNYTGSQAVWGFSDQSDREDDPGESGIADQDGLSEQLDGEPALGSFDRMLDQTKSWRQRDIPGVWWPPVDGELDTADHEPSLGSLACIPTYDPRFGWYGSQADWAYSGTDDRENEHDGREYDTWD